MSGRGPPGHARGVIAAWFLAIAPAALLAILLARPVWDVDIFWQLKLGELILAHGGPLAREPFAATHLGQPMPAFAWLGQAVMAAVRRLGGWDALRVFDALCWLGGFLAIAAACRRRSGSAAGVLLALAIAFVAALPAASLRPQSFAALCFGALLAVLRLDLRRWQASVLIVPLLLIWQNLHPSVGVAIVALGAHAGLGWWQRFRRGAPAPWELSLLTLIAGAAMFATPDGADLFAWSARNAARSAAMGVSEWLPLWDAINRFEAVPVLLVAVVVCWTLLRGVRRTEPGELATAIALFAMTVVAYRFVLFWALALIPVVARAVPPPPVERRTPAWLPAIALIVVAVVLPLARPTRFAAEIPLGAIERLRASGIEGTIFAHFPWGGPLIDSGYPRWRVAYDGRYYRYTSEEWRRYRGMTTEARGLDEIERIYRPAAFVLSPDGNAGLIAALRADRTRWQELSADRLSAVFVRKTAAAS
jgi:hypothetical protein